MTVEQLNLESIPEEVLDECFENENESFENLRSQGSDDVLEEVETDSTEGAFEVLDSKLKLPNNLTNEYLIQEIRAGNDVKKNTALIVKYNAGLVYGQARQCTCNIPFQDKVQYGFEGLLKAIQRYDLDQKIQFSTYATVSIRQTMYNYGNDDVRMIAIPRYLSVNNIQIQNYIDKHRSQFGRTPSADEISTGTGIDGGAVQRVLEYMNNRPMSIDTPISNNADNADMSLGDIIKGTSKEYTLSENTLQGSAMDVIALVMAELPEAEQYLLSRVHGLNGHVESTFASLEGEGLVDGKGKVMKSHSTIHRRYNDIITKIRRILQERFVTIED